MNKRFPFSPHPLQHLFFCEFFNDGSSDQSEMVIHWSFDLHFSSIERVEHLCMCILPIWISSLEKCLFSSAHFLIGLFVFLILSFMSCLYILEMNSLSVVSFAVIFSHSEGCLFTLLLVSFLVQKLFKFD